jgi:hypothetical protein
MFCWSLLAKLNDWIYTPFAYLRHVSEIVKGRERPSQTAPENETGGLEATCSSRVLVCGHYKTQSEHSVNLNRKTQFLKFIAFPQFISIERFSNRV